MKAISTVRQMAWVMTLMACVALTAACSSKSHTYDDDDDDPATETPMVFLNVTQGETSGNVCLYNCQVSAIGCQADNVTQIGVQYGNTSDDITSKSSLTDGVTTTTRTLRLTRGMTYYVRAVLKIKFNDRIYSRTQAISVPEE